jgi:predicted dehydrogenase/nucleoside-diphosphate-sugar epimerase
MKAEKRSIRVGFLGTGYIADWHAKALRTVPGCSLVAICDRHAGRARAFGESHKVARVYAELDAMLGDPELDVVHVLLPPGLHGPAGQAVIDSGRHVLLEKPMAATAEECASLAEAAQAKGVKIGVGHNFLFSPVYEALRGDIKAGRLGRPDLITLTWHKGLDQATSGPFNMWMLRDPRNIVLEVGPHLVSALLDLAGPLEIGQVRATNKLELPTGQPFYRRWQVTAGDGATSAVLNFSFAPGFSEHSIHIRGTLASAVVDFEANTYVLNRHTPYDLDFDRHQISIAESRAIARQARRTLAGTLLSKVKLSKKGNPYGESIARSLQSFYGGLNEPTVDRRIGPELGTQVIAFCQTIGSLANLDLPSETDTNPRSGSDSALIERNAETRRPAAEILVLGATGFIGRELTRRLLQDHEVVRVMVRDPGRLPSDLFGNPRVEVITGDLSRTDDLNKALDGIRFVYHLARPMVKTWPEFVEGEIEVTRRVAEACLDRKVERLLYTSTIDSYYAGKDAGTITEETPLDPRISSRNYYARAKAASEEILKALRRERGLPVVIFRPGIVIGRGSSPFHWGVGMWSWNSVCQIWGSGRNPLPLVLVEDVADAMACSLAVPGIEGESFNLAAAPGLSAHDYIAEVERYAGVELQKIPTAPWKLYIADLGKWAVKRAIRHPDRRQPSYRDWESRTQRAHYDCSKARKLLNWTPVDDRDLFIRRGIHESAKSM